MNECIYLYSKEGLKQLTGKDLLNFLSKADDEKIFLVNGKDFEIYIVEDLATISKLESIANRYPEKKAITLMLKLINPGKYGK